MFLRKLMLFCFVILTSFYSTQYAHAATAETVWNDSDSGYATLRDAITNGAENYIIFANTVTAISLTSPITITRSIILDGGGDVMIEAPGNTIFVMSSGSANSMIDSLAMGNCETAIVMSASHGTRISDCRIGMDWLGNTGYDVTSYGLVIFDSNNVEVGTNVTGSNIIGQCTVGLYGNHSYGLMIQNNIFGLASDGATQRPNDTAIYLESCQGAMIGGDRTASNHNILASSTQSALTLANSSGNTLAGNIIGLSSAQTLSRPNQTGIVLANSHFNVIGMSAVNQNNIISANATHGIYLSTSNNNSIQNNYIGINGTNGAAGNGVAGIYLTNSHSNLVGGDFTASTYKRNIIAGQDSPGAAGILLTVGASGNTISGNVIGCAADLTTIRENYIGISINDASGNLIGGDNSFPPFIPANIIGGNTTAGLLISSGRDNNISGNIVGTDGVGNAAGNQVGISCITANTGQNWIGGTTTGQSNYILNNSIYGLSINNSANNLIVSGNFFGLEGDGTTQAKNGIYDIFLNGQNCLIGGPSDANRNMICSNGIYLASQASGNTIAANWIGVDTNQTMLTDSILTGVFLFNGADNNWIGYPEGPGNLMSFVNYGIVLNGADTDQIAIFGNTITVAATEPIYFATAGANNDKAVPSITGAFTNSVFGTSGANDTIELFRAESGTGSGGAYQLLTTTAADSGGNWLCSYTGAVAGDFLCALATDSNRNTSEYSSNVIVSTPPTATPTATISATVTLTSTITPTSTETPFLTPTPTRTMTMSPTLTVTPTISATFTESPTPTTSSTITQTATITVTSTISPTPTATPSSTFSPTATATNALGSVDLNGQAALAYPNPAKDEVHFLLHLASQTDVVISVFNIAGEKVTELNDTLAGEGQTLLWNCSTVAPGLYIAVISENGTVKGKIKIVILK